jgi:hypothetical protein
MKENVLIVLVALLMLGGFLVPIVGMSRCEPATSDSSSRSSPGDVDEQFFAHLRAQNWSQAYALMTENYRSMISLERFTAAVEDNPYFKSTEPESVRCSSIKTTEGVVHHRQCILFSKAGATHCELFFAADKGEWRLTGVTLGGLPALPGHP